MEIKNNTVHNVVLSEDVIAQMVSTAACEIEGVCSLVPNPNIKKIFSSKTTQSVNVKYSQDSMVIELFVKLKTGVNITSVCEAIQDNVKKTIQNMTNTPVSKVNIVVADIDIPTED